ncbi:MAG: T9SS C-terminal target domain-containing protein [Bacteroidales bacterium]|nr:T9SS C-terminal target domain-containing protein [Bacteroidales bacterium]
MVTHYIINGKERESDGTSLRESVKENLTISARVEQVRPCTVTITQPEHGTLKVTSAGNEIQSGNQINSGATLALELTPETGYEIEYWIINGKKSLPNENADYRYKNFVPLQDDITLSAQLKVEGTKTMVPVTIVNPEFATIKAYKGTSSSAPELQPGEKLEVGSDLTVVITPSDDVHALDHWLVNDEPIEKDSGYFADQKRLKVVEATTISAVLKESGYTITYEQPEHGTLKVTTGYPDKDVPSGSRVKEGAWISIRATVETGYQFKHFLINGEVKVPSSLAYPYLYEQATSDMTIEAVIEKPQPCIVTLTPFEHGTLSVKYGSYINPTIVASGDEVPSGTKLTITVAVDPKYEFKHFLIDGKEEIGRINYKGENELEYTLTKSVTISVVTEERAMTVVTIDPFEHGELSVSYGPYDKKVTVHTGDAVPQGIKLDVYAWFDDGYALDHFLVNGETKPADDLEYIGVTVGETPLTLSAVAKRSRGQIVMIQPKEGQGTLTAYYFDNGEQKDLRDGIWVALETSVTFHVEPAEGYEMDYWLVNDVRTELEAGSLVNNKTLIVNGDLKVEPVLKATAAPIETVRLSVQEEGVGGFAMVRYQTPGSTIWEKPAKGANPTLDLPIGTKVKVMATIAIHGSTVAFTHNGAPVATDQLTDEGLTYAFTLEEAADIKVIFTEGVISFQVFYDCDEHATITGTADGKPFTSGDKLAPGTHVELIVTPEAGYEVKCWQDADYKPIAGTEGKTTYTFTVEGLASYNAAIQKKTTAFVKVSSEGSGGHLETKYVEPNGTGNPLSIFGEKRIPLGSVVTVKAKITMPGNYQVTYTNNGKPVSAEALSEDGLVYTFTANEDADVHAVFSEAPAPQEDYTITFEAGEGGTVTATVDTDPIESGAKIAAGTKIKILATPDENYEIDEWLIDGTPIANTGLNFYYLSLSKDTNVKVTFRSTKPVEYVVTVDPVLPSAEAGTVQLFKKNGDAVESGKSVVTGTEMYVEVKPADKYELETLQVNDKTIKVGDENLVNLSDGGYKYVFTVTGVTTIQATFKQGGAVEQLSANPIVAYVTNGGTRLEIVGATEGVDIRLYDYTGQLLLSSTEHALDISALPTGSYIVLVGNYTTRIVK